jgi:diaminopropionate ammonia-lyase
MGALLHAATNPELYKQLRLTPNSQIVLFGCEGATDPAIYERITGQSPEQVFARQ